MSCWSDLTTSEAERESKESAAVYLLIEPDRKERGSHRELVRTTVVPRRVNSSVRHLRLKLRLL
jgi:hypothetical protein